MGSVAAANSALSSESWQPGEALASRRPLVCVRPSGWLSGEDDGAFTRMAAWVRHAEALGFDGIFLGDRMLSQAAARGQAVTPRRWLS